jgi:hypothetical protein
VVLTLLTIGLLSPVLAGVRLVSEGGDCGCDEDCPCRSETRRCSCSQRNGLSMGSRCGCGRQAPEQAPPLVSWEWYLGSAAALHSPEPERPVMLLESLVPVWLLAHERAHPS